MLSTANEDAMVEAPLSTEENEKRKLLKNGL
jgi:hypothetical protein